MLLLKNYLQLPCITTQKTLKTYFKYSSNSVTPFRITYSLGLHKNHFTDTLIIIITTTTTIIIIIIIIIIINITIRCPLKLLTTI